MTNHKRSRASLRIIICLSIVILCNSGGYGGSQATVLTKTKGGDESMDNHPMGRFSISVPTTMELKVHRSKLRKIDVEEFSWPLNLSHELALENLWKARLAEIADIEAPEGKEQALIEARDFPQFANWAKGVFYYKNRISTSEAKWDVMVDTGKLGLWLKTDSILVEPLNVEKAVLNIGILAQAYRRRDPKNTSIVQGTNWFYLRNGAIDLPYRWQEQTYARFEGHPLNLKLEIEMQETHHVAQAGLIERLGAVIATNYAPRVDVKKIRSHRRTVAGLKGEDVIIRTKDRYNTVLCFAWEYPGEVNSGERPEIQITMESPDGALEEKIKVWDAILDSFKPM